MTKVAAETIILSVKSATKLRLEKLARMAGRTSSHIATEALSEYLDLNEAQVAGITEAIDTLDNGQSIPHERVREWVLSWNTSNELPKPRPAAL